MNLLVMLEGLPQNLRISICESLIRNETVKESVGLEIVQKINELFVKPDSKHTLLETLFPQLDDNERKQLLKLLAAYEPTYYNKLANRIFSIEDIINLDAAVVQRALNGYDTEKLVKALKGVSPTVSQFLLTILKDEGIEAVQKTIGSISTAEIESVHAEILERINVESQI